MIELRGGPPPRVSRPFPRLEAEYTPEPLYAERMSRRVRQAAMMSVRVVAVLGCVAFVVSARQFHSLVVADSPSRLRWRGRLLLSDSWPFCFHHPLLLGGNLLGHRACAWRLPVSVCVG